MKQHIPNLLTCGNVFCGSLGIIFCADNQLVTATYLIFLAGIFDFFDGFAARALKVSSPIGKELDSLADMVSFGVLPAFILYKLILPLDQNFAYVALLISVFSALRLAKFNVDTRQSESFIGVPTTANAPLISSLPVIIEQHPTWQPYIQNLYLLVGLAVVMSFLLVSELPLIALKFKEYSFVNNKFKYILLISSILLFVFLQFAAVPLILVLYILLSVIKNITDR
ncbi:MAG: CDP-diacylglycerol--serine O-phosphatidyltransferase [Bacteroidetes bacterium]|nr:MAG: CDP-diacylglycerol--serine O-phosphatidyltransferase [Bacteroidota bacterium]